MSLPPALPPADPVAAGLAFLKAQLAKPVTLRGAPALALAETAQPFNDSRWYWTDDNAKALELLALPAIRNADPEFTDRILDFVLGMSSTDLIWRRLAEPQLKLQQAQPEDFRLLTPFHSLHGDLRRGVILQSGRFNDDRDRVAAAHTGNLIEFTIHGRAQCLDVEDTITDCGVERTAEGVILFHESTLIAPAALFGNRTEKVATLRYEYAVRADSPVIRLTVRLRPEPGVTLKSVRLSTGSDALSDQPRHCRIGTEAGYASPALPATGQAYVHHGPFRQLVLQEGGLAGYAHALHIRPQQPERVRSVSATVTESGRLHWCVTRYEAGTVGPGSEFAIEENRLLVTGGTLVPTPGLEAPLQAPAEHPCIDPSASYDYGAELNAIATYWASGTLGLYRHPVPPEKLATLRAWFDRHLEAFFASTAPAEAPGPAIFVRGMSFAILALDTMLQASGEGRYRLAREAALDMLLQRQQGGENDGLFIDTGGIVAHLDCQAAAILALARLARPGCDARVPPALRRAVLALRLGTLPVPRGDIALPFDTIVVRTRKPDGHLYEEGAFWTYKVGLLLRALKQVRARRQEGRLPWLTEEWDRLGRLIRLCQDQLATTARRRPEGVEHLTSPVAGETNSETQPWVLLALVASELPLPVAAAA
ncbi:hypothetical protein JYK14_16370 [Siccirubricoccus sp. KC 17139]|uniref:Uncharacterized protein n=1 Tax=Siccirubricoccus soli TaxID=2899147 RepID=A0ABT1D714_9PROT|nr:hypothetical protein [Siccirubricoccus soli]MCO6417725.1 hypothetical protein [Siccirubricoccus soli]MCP2683860.1 hypothetical protein [Siccirubricoccus soli]